MITTDNTQTLVNALAEIERLREWNSTLVDQLDEQRAIIETLNAGIGCSTTLESVKVLDERDALKAANRDLQDWFDAAKADLDKATTERDAARALVYLQRVALAESDAANDALRDKLAALDHWNRHYTTIECPQCGFEGGREHAAAPREPLTREQVKEMLNDAGYSKPQEQADFINGVRNCELSHGIGVKQ